MGGASGYIFVVDSGSFEVRIDGTPIATLARGPSSEGLEGREGQGERAVGFLSDSAFGVMLQLSCFFFF